MPDIMAAIFNIISYMAAIASPFVSSGNSRQPIRKHRNIHLYFFNRAQRFLNRAHFLSFRFVIMTDSNTSAARFPNRDKRPSTGLECPGGYNPPPVRFAPRLPPKIAVSGGISGRSPARPGHSPAGRRRMCYNPPRK